MAGPHPVTLQWRHLGGMVAAIPAAGIAGGALSFLSGEPLVFPALALAGMLAALVHVALFAMPLFALVLALDIRPTVWRVLLTALLIGVLPFSIITGTLAWWAGLAGLAGGFAFWVMAGPWETA